MIQLNDIWQQRNNHLICTGNHPTHVTLNETDFYKIRNEIITSKAVDEHHNIKLFGMKVIRTFDIKEGVILITEQLT